MKRGSLPHTKNIINISGEGANRPTVLFKSEIGTREKRWNPINISAATYGMQPVRHLHSTSARAISKSDENSMDPIAGEREGGNLDRTSPLARGHL